MTYENLISIIIPTYNRSNLIKKAIESVLNQTYKNVEIIVVDDNNPNSLERDETKHVMESYEKYSQVKYILHEKNKGGCAARNTGIKSSKGDYIAFLDDDDIWDNYFLEKMIKLFNNDSIGAVYCSYYIGTDKRVFYHNKKDILFSGNVYEKLLSGWCPASTSFFLIKKECFNQVGYFDERLDSFQDYDMWLRISQKFEFNYTSERLVTKYEHSYEQISLNPYKRQRGLNVLEQKLKYNLCKREYDLFEEFKKKHECEITKNMILYNKFNRKKLNYWTKYYSYLKLKEKNKKDIIILFCVILFGIKFYECFEYLKFYIFKKKYIIIEDSLYNL